MLGKSTRLSRRTLARLWYKEIGFLYCVELLATLEGDVSIVGQFLRFYHDRLHPYKIVMHEFQLA
jgi:hypothetical protein